MPQYLKTLYLTYICKSCNLKENVEQIREKMEKIQEKLKLISLNTLCRFACIPAILLIGIGVWLCWKSSFIGDDLKNLSLFFRYGGTLMVLLGIILLVNFIKIKMKENFPDIKTENYILLFGGILSLLPGIGYSIIATNERGEVDYFFLTLGSALIIFGLGFLIIAILKIIQSKKV